MHGNARQRAHGLDVRRPDGIVGFGGRAARTEAPPAAELLRPLAEYERLLGGAW